AVGGAVEARLEDVIGLRRVRRIDVDEVDLPLEIGRERPRDVERVADDQPLRAVAEPLDLRTPRDRPGFRARRPRATGPGEADVAHEKKTLSRPPAACRCRGSGTKWAIR